MAMTESETCEGKTIGIKYTLSNFTNHDKGIPIKDHEGVMFE